MSHNYNPYQKTSPNHHKKFCEACGISIPNGSICSPCKAEQEKERAAPANRKTVNCSNCFTNIISIPRFPGRMCRGCFAATFMGGLPNNRNSASTSIPPMTSAGLQSSHQCINCKGMFYDFALSEVTLCPNCYQQQNGSPLTPGATPPPLQAAPFSHPKRNSPKKQPSRKRNPAKSKVKHADSYSGNGSHLPNPYGYSANGGAMSMTQVSSVPYPPFTPGYEGNPYGSGSSGAGYVLYASPNSAFSHTGTDSTGSNGYHAGDAVTTGPVHSPSNTQPTTPAGQNNLHPSVTAPTVQNTSYPLPAQPIGQKSSYTTNNSSTGRQTYPYSTYVEHTGQHYPYPPPTGPNTSFSPPTTTGPSYPFPPPNAAAGPSYTNQPSTSSSSQYPLLTQNNHTYEPTRVMYPTWQPLNNTHHANESWRSRNPPDYDWTPQ